MSATAGVVLKKVGLAVVTNPKILKTIIGIALGIIIIIIMPIVAVVAIFNGDIKFDTNRLQEMVVENLSDEEKEKLHFVEDTMANIDTAMTDAGYDSNRVKEAQVLYILALSDNANKEDFIPKLVGCFSKDQTDEQLISSVNSTFKTSLKSDDFGKIMNSVRSTYIDLSDYIDSSHKNNLDLVKWAKSAAKNKWGYVYGTYGTVLTESLLVSKASQYPSQVGSNIGFIRQHWLGRRTCDCVGLIKSYGWYNADTGKTVIGSNGMPDVSANGMYNSAKQKGPIKTIPDVPGLAVWHVGHIGVYIGNGQVIQAANTRTGVILTKITDTAWTHWLKIPFIDYVKKDAE